MPLPLSRPQLPSWRKLGTSAIILVAGRVVTSVCGLLQVPLALLYMDAEQFGTWMACTGLLWTIGTIDLGLGFAVQNRMTSLIALGQAAEAATLGRWARKWLWCAALGLLAISPLIAYFGRWADWFGIGHSALAAQVPGAILVVLVATAINLPLSIHHREVAALQEPWVSGLWSAVASVVTLGLVALFVVIRAPLTAFVAASSVLLVGPAFATRLHLRRLAHWCGAGGKLQAGTDGLARESMLFFMPQIGAAFIGSFVPTLVALFAGPVAAMVYSVLQKIYGFVLQLLTLTQMPTWPAYRAAVARGEFTETRRTFRTALGVAVGGFALPTLALTPWVPALVDLWLGARAPVIPLALLWLVAGWNAIQMAGQPLAMLLNGLGRIASLTYVGLVGLGLTLVLCQWWGPLWGAAGIVAALIVPYVVINIPLLSWQAVQGLRRGGSNAA